MNTVISYPYITPPSADWLKLAALCWDKIYRLSPQGWPNDPNSVTELDEALGGILGTVNVEKYTDTIWDPFWSYVDEREDELRRGRWVPDFPKEEEVNWWLPPSTLFWQYEVNMITESFVEGLQERGLARIEKDLVYGRTIHLPQDVGFHYLSLCASEAAKEQRMDLAAYEHKYTDAVLHEYSVRGELATAVLQAYLPEHFSSLEPERIRDFREEFSGKRLKYQTAVQDIVNQYMNTASEGTLESVKKQIEDLAKDEINETEKTYRRANQKMVLRTLGMSLTPPAIATFIGSALGIGIFAPAGIVAALSLFGAGLLIDRDETQSEKEKSPWSYVLDAAKL